MIQIVQPAERLSGTVDLPPDKSIAHRSAMFASLCERGTNSNIENYSKAADPQSTLSCLRQLGVQIDDHGRNRITVHGVGRNGFCEPDSDLDCGNSGTTMRLMSGILAGAGIRCRLIGDDSLSKRTMQRIIDPLHSMGARISGVNGDYAPLEIEPHTGIKPIRYPMPLASAQLKSAVLLAGLFGEESTTVIETVQSRDHTERLLDLEVEIFGTDKMIRSSVNSKIPTQNYFIPGDFSAASFWLAAGALHRNSNINLPKTGLNPSRIAFLNILREMGASVRTEYPDTEGREPVADLSVCSSELRSIELKPSLVANCIDELPILMVVMCFAEGRSVITGARELRHKETDRLTAMGNVLTSAGAKFNLFEDGIEIFGNPDFRPSPAAYKSEHDHRIAMSAAVLSLMSEGPSKISNAECTQISYPGFWNDLQSLS